MGPKRLRAICGKPGANERSQATLGGTICRPWLVQVDETGLLEITYWIGGDYGKSLVNWIIIDDYR